MREILSQLARHRGDAVDHALLEPACAKIGFHRAADRAPTGLADLGVDTTPRLKVLSVVEPQKRQEGVKVADVAELVDKLRNEAKVI